MAKLVKEDLIKSHIAFAKRLIAEGVDIQNMNDDVVDEGIAGFFNTITPQGKINYAQKAIESNDPAKMYDAIKYCFQFATGSFLAQQALKTMTAEQLKSYLERGIKYNFDGFIKPMANKSNGTDVAYNPLGKAKTFGSAEHAALK